jgi:hypothetical protein
MARMDPNATDMALAVWNGYVHDATTGLAPLEREKPCSY